MKKSRFFIIAAILISSMITGIAHAYTGGTMYFLKNPPNTRQTWTFYGGYSINVVFSNLTRYYTFVSISCPLVSVQDEFITIQGDGMYSRSFTAFAFATAKTAQWTFILDANPAPACVSASATW